MARITPITHTTKKAPAFNPEVFFDLVQGEATVRTYKDKQAVFTQGEEADSVFYIESGKIRLTVVGSPGTELEFAL